MQGSPESTSPSWIEGDSFRETTLRTFDDPQDREALRHVGRLLFHLAVERRCVCPSDDVVESPISSELRAAVADLRYLEGYLEMVGQSGEWSSLSVTEEALAHFASKMGRRVGRLANVLEEEL